MLIAPERAHKGPKIERLCARPSDYQTNTTIYFLAVDRLLSICSPRAPTQRVQLLFLPSKISTVRFEEGRSYNHIKPKRRIAPVVSVTYTSGITHAVYPSSYIIVKI